MEELFGDFHSTTVTGVSARDALGLRGWASGYLPYVAAVELLLTSTVGPRLVPYLITRDETMVWLNIDAGKVLLDGSPLSSGERRVGYLVLELAEVVSGHPLGDLLSGICDQDVAAFLNASAIAAGWHERSIGARITGRLA